MTVAGRPLRFALIAGALFALLIGGFEASRGTDFERFVVEDLILMPTHRIIDRFWPEDHVVLIGRTFESGGSRLNVTRGCEGVEMFLMLTAAIVAWSGTLRARAGGLLAGLALAYGLSVARLVALVYILRHAPRAWEALHGLVLPLAPVLGMAWFFHHWSLRAGRPVSRQPAHAG